MTERDKSSVGGKTARLIGDVMLHQTPELSVPRTRLAQVERRKIVVVVSVAVVVIVVAEVRLRSRQRYEYGRTCVLCRALVVS